MKNIHYLFIIIVLGLFSTYAWADGAKINPNQEGKGVYSDISMAKRALPYAKISAATYDNIKKIKLKRTNTNWELALTWKELLMSDAKLSNQFKIGALAGGVLSGFNANLYKNSKTHEVVLAFAGTDFSLPDVLTDIEQGLTGGESVEQYQLALELTEIAKKKYGANLHLTGHSLGGGLAQYAALHNDVPAVTFNAAGLCQNNLVCVGNSFPKEGDTVININLEGDPVSSLPLTKQIGTEYIYDTGSSDLAIGKHKIATVIAKLTEVANKKTPDALQWANVNIAKNSLLAIVEGGTSHIGSPTSSYFQNMINNTNKLYSSNYKATSGQNTTPPGTFLGASDFAETEWVMEKGDANKNLQLSNTFGSISSPTGSQIASLNNADEWQTTISKQFIVPKGVHFATFSAFANFVTTEWPDYFGTKFDDTTTVKIITPAGNSINLEKTLFSAHLNQGKLADVSGLPAPLAGWNANDGGGATGWKKKSVGMSVAPGGKVTLEVTVNNLGDKNYPSAILLNDIGVK